MCISAPRPSYVGCGASEALLPLRGVGGIDIRQCTLKKELQQLLCTLARMFAGAVMLGDLDDCEGKKGYGSHFAFAEFIRCPRLAAVIVPSQACVNPLFAAPKLPTRDDKGGARIAIDSDLLCVCLPVGTRRTPSSLVPTLLRLPSAAQVPQVGFIAPPQAQPNLIKRTPGTSAATLSLADCLACSGCVTSAETVLITQQSAAEFRRAIADARFTVRVVSIAPQALASIAVAFGLDSVSCYRRLTTYFASLGVHHVLDTGACTALSLVESCREFVERLEATPVDGAKQPAGAARLPWVAPPASRALSSTRDELVRDYDADGPAGDAVAAAYAALAGGPPPLPLLCAACPGWVCYAEKTVPEAIPYMSTIKSPQQLLGALVKALIGGGGGVVGGVAGEDVTAALACATLPAAAVSRIHHTTIMPCYDKKLEASRRDFFWEDIDSSGDGCVREVDCVLAAREVVDMIREDVGDLASVPETPRHGPAVAAAAAYAASVVSTDGTSTSTASPDATVDINVLFCSLDASGARFVGPCAGAGGESDAYSETLARFCVHRFGGDALPEGPLPWAAGRNPDFRELSVSVWSVGGSKRRELRFALAYGFRNIQTIVNRLKKRGGGGRRAGASAESTPVVPPWHYVEVMACPSGCVNGGGQQPRALASATVGEAAEAAVTESAAASVSRLLHERAVERPWESAGVVAIEAMLASRGFSASQRMLLMRTRFHHVPKLETTLIRW